MNLDLPDADLDGQDLAWLNITELDELAKCMNTCVERWKNAGPEARKKMFALFAVAGIFLAVCRHGHVLVLCDMIRSGELYAQCSSSEFKLLTKIYRMKYPIAIVDRLIDMYGPDICLGYDIMCAFITTLTRSCLGAKVAAFRLSGVVPSFHGHAHNRGCQLHWHPMYMEGVGLEDFEECERTFAKSNELASVTRLASPYHRHQHIDEHFTFHDQDKHAASGKLSRFVHLAFSHPSKEILYCKTTVKRSIRSQLMVRSSPFYHESLAPLPLTMRVT